MNWDDLTPGEKGKGVAEAMGWWMYEGVWRTADGMIPEIEPGVVTNISEGEFDPSQRIQDAYYARLWVRGQGRAFRMRYEESLARQAEERNPDIDAYLAWVWFTFEADWPDCISRAVVEAAYELG
jgi:hypothetical protein